jgi:hypothetical protein
MGTTPIYGFPYPDPSDLVANYPALGQQLAEDVETEISTIPRGLVHISTQSFSAVASVSFNNVFTSTYANYLLIASLTMSATTGALSVRMRASAADNTTSNYTRGNLTITSAGVVAGTGAASQASWDIGGTSSTNSGRVWQIINPELAEPTVLIQQGVTRGTSYFSIYGGFSFDGSSQFDGLNLFPASGTITGSIRLYGYQNS